MIELRVTFTDDEKTTRVQITILKTDDATKYENEFAKWMEKAIRSMLCKVKKEWVFGFSCRTFLCTLYSKVGLVCGLCSH